MLVVIDYNVGNVKSVCNAFRHIGCHAKLSCAPEDIKSAEGLILPGVAAFGYAVSALGPLAELIKEQLKNKTSMSGPVIRCFSIKARNTASTKASA